MEWFSKIYGIMYSSLRYFNAAGFDVNKKILGREKKLKILIPLIMEVAKGINLLFQFMETTMQLKMELELEIIFMLLI